MKSMKSKDSKTTGNVSACGNDCGNSNSKDCGSSSSRSNGRNSSTILPMDCGSGNSRTKDCEKDSRNANTKGCRTSSVTNNCGKACDNSNVKKDTSNCGKSVLSSRKTDPQGSYTGKPNNRNDKPIQDSDDL